MSEQQGKPRDWRVSVYVTVDVYDVATEQEALDEAHDAILTQQVKMRDFEFVAEEMWQEEER